MNSKGISAEPDNSQTFLIYGKIAEEIESAQLAGRSADFSQLIAEHPHLVDQINCMIPTIQVLCEVAVDESDEDGNQKPEVESPKQLGDFRVIREIGRGGMGIVYEAEQLSLGRRVALKILPLASFLDERQLQRFKNEACTAALLKHSHIVSIHAVGCERSVHFYAMELIDGHDLAAVVRDGADQSKHKSPGVEDTDPLAKLSTQRSHARGEFYRSVAKIGKQAAEALHFAHEQGVIHRDIKPANLLLDRNGEIHVTDFGLARMQASEGLTISGDLIGTLRYMCPEEVEGNSIADHRADIYSLGLTLYELIAGQPAYPQNSRHQLVKAILSREPVSLSVIDSTVPRDLRTIIEKAISKEPQERYRDARQFADDLDRFLANRTISARPASSLTRASRFARRNPLLTLLFAISTLLFGVIAAGSTTMAWKFSQDVKTETVRRQEREIELRQRKLEVYARDMQLAKSNIEQGNFLNGERILLGLVPSHGEEDYRGIEWYYLWNRNHDSAFIRSMPHALFVADAAFAPDGRLVSSFLRCWDLTKPPTDEPQKLARWKQGFTTRVKIKSGLFLVGDDVGGVIVSDWNALQASSGKPDDPWRRFFHTGTARNVTCSIDVDLDGQYIAAAAYGNHDKGVFEVHRFHPNAISANEDSLLLREEHEYGASAVNFDSHGRVMVTAEKDDRVRVFELPAKEPVATYTLQGNILTSTISPDGQSIALCVKREHGPQHSECWIEIRVLHDWSERFRFHLPGSESDSLCFSSDGRTLLVGDTIGKLWTVDVENHKIANRQMHDREITSVDFSPDGSSIATTGLDGFIHVMNSEPTKEVASSKVRCREGETSAVWGAAFLDNQRVSTSRADRYVDIWDSATGEMIATKELEPGFGNWIRLQSHPANHLLVAVQMQFPDREVDISGRITVWDTRSLETIGQYNFPNGLKTIRIGISPDGRYLAVPGNRWVNLIDLRLKEVRVKKLPCTLALSCSFSADGKTLACGVVDGQTHLLDPETLDSLCAPLETESIKQDGATFIPGSDLLAVVGGERRLKLFDTKTGDLIRTSERYSQMLTTVVPSRDGSRLAVGAMDGKFRIFRTEDCQELISFEVPHNFCFGDFSPDGQSLVVAANRDAFVIRGSGRDQLKDLSVTQLRQIGCLSNDVTPK